MEISYEKIKNIFLFVRNGISIKQDEQKDGIPITRIETIWNSSIDNERFGYANILENNLGKFKDYLMEKGDILMTHINSPKHLGKNALYEGCPTLLIHGMNLLNLRPKKEILFPKFAFYYFNSGIFKSFIPKISNQSVNQASFSAGKLKEIQIPLPPLPEQKRIADILDKADALRKKNKEILEQYDLLAQSIFLEMFGDPVRNPKGWEKKILRKAGEIKTGNTPSRAIDKYYGKYIEWVKTDNINTPEIYATNAEEYLSKEGAKKGRISEENTLLVTCIAGSKRVIGNVAITGRKVSFNQQINSFTPFEGQILFYYYLFIVGKKHIQSFSTNSMKGMINKSKFEHIDFIIPPIELQNQFATIIENIEKQKELAKQSLQESEDLFNGLLQSSFAKATEDTKSFKQK